MSGQDDPGGARRAAFDTGLAPEDADGRLVHAPWGAVATFRRADGTWIAASAWCPHVDGPLWEGSRGGADELACPWHGWRFSLRTGRCTWAPPADAAEAAGAGVELIAVEVGPAGTLVLLSPPREE